MKQTQISAATPLHLEITSRCMLACNACPRTEYKGHYQVLDLSLEAIQKIAKNISAYSGVLLCGDHGDPIYHPAFHDVLKLLTKDKNAPPINIATNGCYRDEKWWEETCRILRPQDIIIFGIDGLEDTFHLYRKNAIWKSATDAIRTIKRCSSIQIHWQWILFNFNQDQLPRAHEYCREWGIDCFRILKSYRHQSINQFNSTITIEEAYERFQSANLPSL